MICQTKHRPTSLFLVSLCAALFTGAGLAQEGTRGSLVILVEDRTEAVIPGATVKIEASVQPLLTGETGSRGEILFSNLIPGTYEVTVTAKGFKTAMVGGIGLRLAERRSVIVTLEPGELVQVVEVVGGIPSIDLSTNTTGGHIEDIIYNTVPIQRGITSAFFLAPGVSDSGGDAFEGGPGSSNPSVGGGSGLDNLYLIDGVNVTHGGFGGFGTTSRIYGSLGSGTTTSFIKEVEVKSGGYEAKYGQSLGGIFNVITKTGGNELYGAIFGYYAPNKLEAGRKQANRFRVENFERIETHGQMSVDFGFEVGGYFLKDRLFFFGSVNPVITRVQRKAPQVFDRFAFGPGDCDPTTNPDPSGNLLSSQSLAGCSDLGSHDITQRTLNYAFKLTGQITQNHRVEASLFGDPSVTSFGPQRRMTGSIDPVFKGPTDFTRLDFSGLNFVLRYNGVLTPSWLINSHFGNNHNRFEEQELFPAYRVEDRTVPGQRTIFGGLGGFENGISDEKLLSLDNTNIFGFLGMHEFTEGFYFATSRWKGINSATGPDFPVVDETFFTRPPDLGLPILGSSYRLHSCMVTTVTPDCLGAAPAQFSGANDTFIARGGGSIIGDNFFSTNRYTAAYIQDNWQLNKYLTLKLGLRWEQEKLEGDRDLGVGYSFTGSWGPRIGVILDPFGRRRTKVHFNFARFFQRLPNDLAQRAFSGFAGYFNLRFWVEPDKIVRPDQAHYVGVSQCPTDFDLDGIVEGTSLGYLCVPLSLGGGRVFLPGEFFGNTGTAPLPGTKMAFQDEFGFGLKHEFTHGIVVGARYIDRRLQRVTEDANGISIEEASAGQLPLPFPIINPSASSDQFTTPRIVPIGSEPCFPFTENVVGVGNCFSLDSGDAVPDGIADGLPDPIREYRAVEITFERRMQGNWQIFANWRIARLQGNFEGAFRNDNAQSAPGITSLFDFIDSPAMGDTYAVGALPNHRRHVVNAYGSYMFSQGWADGLNLGFGLRVSTGKPLTELLAHPLFNNPGEISCNSTVTSVTDTSGQPIYNPATSCESDGRGGNGRTPFFGTTDLHLDYPLRLSERFRLRGVLDLFNLANARRPRARREFKESVAGLPDPDFDTPFRFQRPFNARFAVRLEW